MTTERNSQDENDGVHRLHDIVVEEVSLVDRAANKRRFLVVKRSTDMADDTDSDFEKDDSALSAMGKAKAVPPTQDDEEDDDDEETQAKASPAHDPDEEENDDEDEGDAGDAPESTPPAAAKPAARRKQEAPSGDAVLQAIAAALEQLMNVAAALKDALAQDASDGTVPAELLEQVAEVANLLSELGQSSTTAKRKAAVTKAGARMARGRLDRFQKAIELLSAILKELTNAAEGTSAAPKKTQKSESTSQPAQDAVHTLASEIRELTRVVKRQEDELHKMRQTRGVSNSIPVNGGRRAEPGDVSWPFDMNRPITRDRVRKEVSFFDD